ncbi:unnamed protein product, partial [Mesorhabditis spiculigera]
MIKPGNERSTWEMKFFLFATLPLLVLGGCPDGFDNAPEFAMCYGSPEIVGHGYDIDERSCQTYGGHLVSIDSIFKNNQIAAYVMKDFAQNRAMIGLRRFPERNDTNWYWSDGSANTYRNWVGSAEPAAGLNCVALDNNDKLWYGVNCGEQIPYMCELTAPNQCLDGWVYNNDTSMCYYHGKDLTFSDAQAFCIRHKGSLTSIHSAAENEFIRALVYSEDCSGEFPVVSGTTLTGGVYSGASLAYWMDGTQVDYTGFCDHNANMASSTVLLRAMPDTCDFGCGGGKWMAGIDKLDSARVYPDFVCKVSPFV